MRRPPRLKRVLRFYVPVPKEELYAIWTLQKELTRSEVPADIGLAEDERVEDAGLEDGLELLSTRKFEAVESIQS